ncbi:hypothetical protein PR202_ga09550 [Eleusine coracana subsp. coracana]|uniref:Serpin domain-containing protein n=1 Tax=Eleusine coracana subsp. coracana TaxID=191504 RepID=A0AAV5C539_ELECO|nr:hypothetical protein QOZ80_1AG0034430 [Eleusine coracana subsp. coracana]GJM93033.1 hypothetical protein PR202_ga09550 [Eleusine coracana subsp. coracana]
MDLSAAAGDEIAFSMRLLGQLARGQGQGGAQNLAVSPLSLHAALVLLGAGARGATLDQIVAVLGPAGGHAHATLASHVAQRVFARGGLFGDGPTLRFANGVWISDALRPNPDYARVLAEHYRAESSSMPFKSTPEEARSKINQWVANATAGRITDLLPPDSVGPDKSAVLANALYFKAAWSSKFDRASTVHDTFYLPASRGHVRVPFMSSTRKQHIVTRQGYKVLRLPYAGGSPVLGVAFAMYIYLPDAFDGLPGLMARLGSSDPGGGMLETSSTMMREVPVRRFRVPRFTMSCKTTARDVLQELGLTLPFDRVRADFGEMTAVPPPEPIYAEEVYHQCFVEVNEEGTEATAATAVAMGFGCAATPPPEDFVADHPFLFLIKEEFAGVVVFAGQVVNPSV